MGLGLEADLLDARAFEEAARRAGEELGRLCALVNLVGGFVTGPSRGPPRRAGAA